MLNLFVVDFEDWEYLEAPILDTNIENFDDGFTPVIVYLEGKYLKFLRHDNEGVILLFKYNVTFYKVSSENLVKKQAD